MLRCGSAFVQEAAGCHEASLRVSSLYARVVGAICYMCTVFCAPHLDFVLVRSRRLGPSMPNA